MTINGFLHVVKKQTLQQYKPVKETYYDFANIFAQPYAELDMKQEWVQELFPHQRSGIISVKEKLDSLNTAVLSDGVGLGKTRTAAGVIRLYLETESVNRILIIADTKFIFALRDSSPSLINFSVMLFILFPPKIN